MSSKVTLTILKNFPSPPPPKFFLRTLHAQKLNITPKNLKSKTKIKRIKKFSVLKQPTYKGFVALYNYGENPTQQNSHTWSSLRASSGYTSSRSCVRHFT
jgi:hypothetical protein